MISEPYKDVSDNIVVLMDQLVDPNNSYHLGHAHRTARTVQTLLDQKPKGKLLELGTSHIVPILLEKLVPNLEVHVTDLDETRKRTSTMTVEMSGFTREVPAYNVDLERQKIPVEDASFDYVLCCEVIEHMELDPMFMISEINRVLKPQGTLILTTPNITSSRAIWKILRGFEPYFYMQYRHTPAYGRHNYEYSPYALTQVLKAGGFDGSVWTENSFEDGVTEDIDRLKAIGYNLNNTGDNIFVVAKKVNSVINRHPAVIYAD